MALLHAAKQGPAAALLLTLRRPQPVLPHRSVNTPTKTRGVGAGKAADLTYWEGAARVIASVSKSSKIIVEKSTVPVKTADAIEKVRWGGRVGGRRLRPGGRVGVGLTLCCAGVQQSVCATSSRPHLRRSPLPWPAGAAPQLQGPQCAV